MSLILRSLKKIKSENSDASVPPNMVGLKVERGVSPKFVMYSVLGLVFVCVLGYFGIYMFTGVDLLRKRPKPVVPVAKHEIPAVAPIEKTVVLNKEDKKIETISPTDMTSLRLKKIIDAPGLVDEINKMGVKSVNKAGLKTENVSNKKADDGSIVKNIENAAEEKIVEVTDNEKKLSEQSEIISGHIKSLDSKEVQINNNLGDAQRALLGGDSNEAFLLYTAVMEKRPSRDIFNNLIISCIRSGNVDKVYEYIDKYKQFAYEEAASNAVYEFIDRDDYKNASLCYEKFASFVHTESGELDYAAAEIAEHNGESVKAQSLFKKAYESSQSNPMFIYAYGRSLEISKEYDKALQVYVTGLKIELEPTMRQHFSDRIRLIEFYQSK